jgi:hypothetical protein
MKGLSKRKGLEREIEEDWLRNFAHSFQQSVGWLPLLLRRRSHFVFFEAQRGGQGRAEISPSARFISPLPSSARSPSFRVVFESPFSSSDLFFSNHAYPKRYES